MKRIFQSTFLFFGAFVFISFLPLFIERTMTRSQTFGGDVIDYNWKITTLYGYISNFHYFRPEEHFAFYFIVNVALAFVYALLISGGFFLLPALVKSRKVKANF